MHGISSRRFTAMGGAALLILALLPASVLAAPLGPPTQLVFGVQPTNTAAAATISPAVTVQVEDAGGNLVTTDASSVTLAVGANPGSGTLGGTLTQAAVGGIATFANLAVNNPGIGYTLHATDGSLTAATSASFTVTGPATKLVFGVQPSSTPAGATISPAVTVRVVDAGGSVVLSAASVTLAIGANPGSATLGGTVTEAAVGGIATFGDLSLNNAGIGYTLSATSSGLAGATSASFTIVGPAAKLVFGAQPTNTAAAATISPAVTVRVVDAGGSLVTTDGSSVTLAIGANPGSGTLGGTLTQAAAGGIATFSNLSINNAGIGYTLHATDGSLTAATSASFTIVGAATRLVFGVQPSDTTAGATISPAVTVRVVDANGSVVTSSTASVVLAIQSNPAAGTLGGTLTQAAVGGVATFANLWIDNAGAGYTLLAASSGIGSVASTSFTITGVNHLYFATQPGGGAAAATWSSQPVVEVLDSSNALVTSDSSTYVYLGISTNPAAGTLSCTSGTSLRVTNGVATFYGCSIDLASSSYYTLGATSSAAYTSATSNAFYVAGKLPTLAMSASSALGNKPASGYSTSTPKVQTAGNYVTWKFKGGAALAGHRVNVLMAKRINNVWTGPAYLKSAWADASGTVTVVMKANAGAVLNLRVQWPGSTTYAASTSKALGAHWR
jgi:hypothetical protein